MREDIRAGTLGDVRPLVQMHASCSPASVERRYLAPMPVLQHRMAAQLLCPVDGFSRVTFRGDLMVGIATVAPDPHEDDDTAEIGQLVLDQFQRQGIGSALLAVAASDAAALGFGRLVMVVHPDNTAVLRMVRAVEMRAKIGMHEGLVRVTICLTGRARPLRWRAS